MAVTARVRTWDADEGCGVLDCDQTPGGCWAHYSAMAVSGFRTTSAGMEVLLEWEAAQQDGYDYRAVRFWPVGAQPVDPAPPTTGSPAYRSTLTITFPDGTTTHRQA